MLQHTSNYLSTYFLPQLLYNSNTRLTVWLVNISVTIIVKKLSPEARFYG